MSRTSSDITTKKKYSQHFGAKTAKIVRRYCHDLGQSERNIFDFSFCDLADLHKIWNFVKLPCEI